MGTQVDALRAPSWATEPADRTNLLREGLIGNAHEQRGLLEPMQDLLDDRGQPRGNPRWRVVRQFALRVRLLARDTRVAAVLVASAWFILVNVLAWTASRHPFPMEVPWPNAGRISPLVRFDAGWYASISERGYSVDPRGGQSNVAFFPLLPLLAGGLSSISGASFFTCGTLIALLSLLLAAALLAQEPDARRAPSMTGLAALLAWPSSFFLASVYTESLFLAAALAAWRSAQRGRWLLAACAGGLAGLSRPNGVMVALLLAPMAVAEVRRRGKAASACLAALAPVAGLASFVAYLGFRFGDPLVGFRAQAAWGRTPGDSAHVIVSRVRDVFERLVGVRTGMGLLEGLELGSLVVFGILTVLVFRAGRVGEGLFCAAVLLMVAASGSLTSAHRYVLVLFPCFTVLGGLLERSRVAFGLYVYTGAGLGAALMTRFVFWVFVG